ncbi:MAG: hypothetical protein ACWGNV_10375 [Bacteroidales bacterium]
MPKSPVLLFWSFVILLSSCSGGYSELQNSGLKGPVKSFKEVRCDPTYSNEKWVAGKPLGNDYRVVYFDREGKFIESFSIDTRGDTLGKSTCTRDENGELVEEVFYTKFWLTPKESRMYPTSKTVLERVNDDQVNFEVWKGDQRVNEGANYYDKKGRLIRQVQVVNSQEMTIHYVYEKNLLVENYGEDINGNRNATQLYSYDHFDDHGNWTLKLIYVDEDMIAPDVAINREIEYY